MSSNPNQILEATSTFITQIDNGRGGVDEYPVYAGRTRVTSSHILARMYPHHFRPVEQGLSYGSLEEMTDEPGSPGRNRQVTPPAAVERQAEEQKAAEAKPAEAAPAAVAKAPAKAPETKPAETKPATETKGLTTKDLRPGGK